MLDQYGGLGWFLRTFGSESLAAFEDFQSDEILVLPEKLGHLIIELNA